MLLTPLLQSFFLLLPHPSHISPSSFIPTSLMVSITDHCVDTRKLNWARTLVQVLVFHLSKAFASVPCHQSPPGERWGPVWRTGHGGDKVWAVGMSCVMLPDLRGREQPLLCFRCCKDTASAVIVLGLPLTKLIHTRLSASPSTLQAASNRKVFSALP